ncbi:hypothetical protein ACLE20_13230 [Rhizobium sp. YIM 134829]|uniref:hypothetical protein n=1 Tax=Rhizobium sp. YIM 134829 TaxID=3390453 RepID=UPI00397B2EFC
MTFLDLPRPAHLSRQRRALIVTLTRFARRPSVELFTAAVGVFLIAYASACQIGG